MRGAKAAVELGRFEESVPLWLAALNYHCGSTEVGSGLSAARARAEDVKRANQLLAEGVWDRAAANLHAPLEAAPHAEHLEVLMVRALLGMGDWKQAASRCESLGNRVVGGDVEVRFLSGMAKYGEGDFEGAVKVWEGALREDPDHEESKRQVQLARKMILAKSEANERFQHGAMISAIEGYTSALALRSECNAFDSKLFFNRSVALGRTGKRQEAIADCCNALDLNPSYTRALLQVLFQSLA